MTLGLGDVTGIDAVAPLTTVGAELLVTVVVAVEEDVADVEGAGAAVVVVVAAAVVPLDDCLRNILDNI